MADNNNNKNKDYFTTIQRWLGNNNNTTNRNNNTTHRLTLRKGGNNNNNNTRKSMSLINIISIVIVCFAIMSLICSMYLLQTDHGNNSIQQMMKRQRVLYQQLKPEQIESLKFIGNNNNIESSSSFKSKSSSSIRSSSSTTNNNKQTTESSLVKMPLKFLPKHPRTIGWYFDDSTTKTSSRKVTKTSIYIGTERIDPNTLYMKGRGSNWHAPEGITIDGIERQEQLKNSREYRHGVADTFVEGDCIPQYEWQTLSFPTCNLLLEQDLTNLNEFTIPTKEFPEKQEIVRLIANGYWRDVWRLFMENDEKTEATTGGGERLVLKTIRYEHEYTPRNYDRHRRDAMAMERLTKSPNVVDIYAFCANSGIFEFADGGDIGDTVWAGESQQSWNSTDRLIVSYQIASGIADLHNVGHEGRAAIAHTDITPSQFVYISKDGMYKLNDFNRARFIRWNKKLNESCPFEIGNNPGLFRSPEEYKYEPETEKIDVYSMGNVLYFLLSAKWPFEELKDKEGQKKIKHGYRPEIPIEYTNSTDPATKAIIQAIRMCWIHDPIKRASARQVQNYFSNELSKLGFEGEEL